MRTAFALLALGSFLLIGCTESSDSGDSGSDSTGTFEGTWTGTVEKTEDNCLGLPDPNRIKFTHRVTQDGEDISLTEIGNVEYYGSGETHLGSTTGSDEFLVVTDLKTDDLSCDVTNTFEYQDIGSRTAKVTRVLLQKCNGSERCRAEYHGAATR